MSQAPADAERFTEFVTRTAAATEALAARLARRLANGQTLALHGELGAGKTVFARGVARGLGITEAVTSPTFTVVQEYPRPDGGWFYHLDLYRIAGARDAEAFGIEDYLFAPDGVSVVEWPERIAELLAPPPGGVARLAGRLVAVYIAAESGGVRRIRLPASWADGLETEAAAVGPAGRPDGARAPLSQPQHRVIRHHD
ncbi:MAG: tRNA threonylcarbamoyladenosine biosynthesis protein TsaE [Lentisphaerae bacterium ADurb.BinA184]|nr:MAG: tRNA threonylcarbamoyladenosine biosynthesis protein TsaE [Lentisphaerae bacterium ADurb.BinA184]